MDYDALEERLKISVGHCLAAVERRSYRPRKDRIRRLRWIEKMARQLTDLLRSLPPDDQDHLSDMRPDELESMADRCDSLAGDLEYEVKWGPDWHQEIKAGLPSPRCTGDEVLSSGSSVITY